jgi:plasmid stabilization system protein ParE
VDYRLLYSQRSLNDLGEILAHIAEEDADAASRFGASLLDHVDLLSRFPRMGGVTRKRPQVRKLLHSPLLVYYRVHENKRLIEILHVRHGSRKQASSAELDARAGVNKSP